jgi:hypothetical protein
MTGFRMPPIPTPTCFPFQMSAQVAAPPDEPPAGLLLGAKPLHRSITVLGAGLVVVSTMVPPIALLAGASRSPTLARAVEFAGQMGDLVGAAVVMWGRLRARQRIG